MSRYHQQVTRAHESGYEDVIYHTTIFTEIKKAGISRRWINISLMTDDVTLEVGTFTSASETSVTQINRQVF